MLAGLGGFLGAVQGGQGGGGTLPGFANTSAAHSTAGPVTVGGLTFAPAKDDVLKVGLLVAAAAVVVIVVTRKR